MHEIVEIRVPPEVAADVVAVQEKARSRVKAKGRDLDTRILKRSIDARGRNPKVVFRVEVWDTDGPPPEPVRSPEYRDVSDAPAVHIIGAGPAGYFAALALLSEGLKPVIFERGKDVRARRRDLRAVQQFGVVDPDSNYCFGEGGAGTYSDGKLYTRANKRGNLRQVLRILVDHGANPDIMIDAHPHIGSNKLPRIVANIRETILAHGGEVHFNSRITDIRFGEHIDSVVVNGEDEVSVRVLILATGHSARDIYSMLAVPRVALEFKPFALGVRIEHPQPLIDSVQYNQANRGPHLPAASYSLACQVGEHGVFSFCMCPGGLVVPAATAPGEIVVNGMSLSRRDSPYANAGTVVSVDETMVRAFTGLGPSEPLMGVEFQKRVEQGCFNAGDGSQKAPAQRLVDFLEGKISADLPDSSYIPGLHSVDVGALLPPELREILKSGIRKFADKMPPYLTNEAVVIATESRTSAPVRIPRDPETRMHPNIAGLFPCGEGAGYAGGIVSAALDGQAAAMAVSKYAERLRAAL